MRIETFYDKGLAHASYAVLSEGKIAVIDPARDPSAYYAFAHENSATIAAVIETHPHADFVSSHLEIHRHTGADILVSSFVGAEYPHKTFDDGDRFMLGGLALRAINTPGHSPDSISVLVENDRGEQVAVFTGDTLFIGDVGRPDLREDTGNMTAAKEQLARDMYRSTRGKLMKLQHDIALHPAHGAGSLCGKALSDSLTDTLGNQIRTNYALAEMSEDDFVTILLEGQPFIPKYFPYDVDLNRKGAPDYETSVQQVHRINSKVAIPEGSLIIDSRPASLFNGGHIKSAINLPDGEKFETWLGSIVGPGEKFYLIAADQDARETLIRKAAKIGYETNIKAALLEAEGMDEQYEHFDTHDFASHKDKFTIVDVRNKGEYAASRPFENSINIPLPEIRERAGEIPADKPVIVHCRSGYRSIPARAIIENALKGKTQVYDFGPDITRFH